MVQRARENLRDGDGQDDEIWCVFDVECPEPHPTLREAVQRARQEKICLAVSNPCFELWLILHHKTHNSYLTSAQATALRAELDRSTGKKVDAACYAMPERLAAALQRARDLAATHRDNGTTFPEDNPSSGMSELLASCGLDPQQLSPPS
ncbi:RloB family protein [Aciditerrimonas ferrireducens]|jgi:hypothetical protein|nr:RloB family protein [Aciditerrimonas ferrireducens]